jgi:hypothetical protein
MEQPDAMVRAIFWDSVLQFEIAAGIVLAAVLGFIFGRKT